MMNRELVDARERTEQALREAKSYNKAKSDFLSRMSHEMRTPMNAIIGMADIARTSMDSNQRGYCLDRIDEASRNLLVIINDMLDMAQIDTGKFELSERNFSFGDMIRSVSETISPAAGVKGLDFEVSVGDRIPDALVADDIRLRQVLVNLLSNAVKYTADGGRVRLLADSAAVGEETQNEGERIIRFEVSDTGIGISEEHRSRLFKPFEQEDNSITREYGGTGLELAITKHIVEMMNGDIRVESELGKGSNFIFTVKVGVTVKSEEVSDGADCDAGMSDADILPGLRVLLTDDIEVNREIIMLLLEDTGVSIDCASDGFEAVEKFCGDNGAYDLLLMDLHMPRMDGFEATRRIRASGMPSAETVPIIAVTADTGGDVVELCVNAGMNAHIGKPVEYGTLIQTITRCLRQIKKS
jgi:CheY-like chemotaxis protein